MNRHIPSSMCVHICTQMLPNERKVLHVHLKLVVHAKQRRRQHKHTTTILSSRSPDVAFLFECALCTHYFLGQFGLENRQIYITVVGDAKCGKTENLLPTVLVRLVNHGNECKLSICMHVQCVLPMLLLLDHL